MTLGLRSSSDEDDLLSGTFERLLEERDRIDETLIRQKVSSGKRGMGEGKEEAHGSLLDLGALGRQDDDALRLGGFDGGFESGG